MNLAAGEIPVVDVGRGIVVSIFQLLKNIRHEYLYPSVYQRAYVPGMPLIHRIEDACSPCNHALYSLLSNIHSQVPDV